MTPDLSHLAANERIRYDAPAPLELVRADDSDPDSATMLRGYVALFNTLSVDLGGFREQITPGAFRQTVAEDNIAAVWNHDTNLVLGRNRAETLSLREDDRGLIAEIQLSSAQWVQDKVIGLARGDVPGASFRFLIRSNDHVTWTETEEDGSISTLLQDSIILREVSAGVTFPAYLETEIEARSQDWARAARPQPQRHSRRSRERQLIVTASLAGFELPSS